MVSLVRAEHVLLAYCELAPGCPGVQGKWLLGCEQNMFSSDLLDILS